MPRIAVPLLACALALANTPANSQAGATPETLENRQNALPSTAGELHEPSAQLPTVDDICRVLEQSAAENALPAEFFARVIWQESRFDAQAVSPKGAAGIAQFSRRPPAGTALPIHSIPLRRCGTRLRTYANC
jgi:soluble lytic murein transglycosylase-like protein